MTPRTASSPQDTAPHTGQDRRVATLVYEHENFAQEITTATTPAEGPTECVRALAASPAASRFPFCSSTTATVTDGLPSAGLLRPRCCHCTAEDTRTRSSQQLRLSEATNRAISCHFRSSIPLLVDRNRITHAISAETSNHCRRIEAKGAYHGRRLIAIGKVKPKSERSRRQNYVCAPCFLITRQKIKIHSSIKTPQASEGKHRWPLDAALCMTAVRQTDEHGAGVS